MKKFIKNNIFGFILGILITSTVCVSAAVIYNANEIAYSNENTEVTNVNDALNELYSRSTEIVMLKPYQLQQVHLLTHSLRIIKV